MMDFDNIVLDNFIIKEIKNKHTEIYEEDGEQYLHCTVMAVGTNGEEILIDIPKISLDWKCISVDSNSTCGYSQNNMTFNCYTKFVMLESKETKSYFNLIVPDEESRLDALLKSVQ